MSEDPSFGPPVGGAAPMVIVNGQAGGALPASDRGLYYGDGLFETVAVHNGRPEFWDRHMARLREGCTRLGLPCVDVDALAREAELLCKRAGVPEGVARGVLKIIISRGSGGRGYRTPEVVHPTRMVSLHPWPEIPETNLAEGVRVRLCDLRLGHQPALAGIKHLNRLESVLARREWDDPDIVEGLLCDGDGLVVAGTMSNLFLVKGGRLRTPDLSCCGVAGVIRAVVQEIAEARGMPFEVTDIPLAEARESQELFLTNSVIGIWPVREFDAVAYAVGPVTRELMENLEKRRALETA
ncbi:MAG: aminodeoxychorismate lyase [Alphaproteobacteria bacterium]